MQVEHNTKGMVVDIDRWVIDGHGKVDLISAIPYLDSIPSFKEYNALNKIPRNELARYIVYVYSWDSFMWKMQLALSDVKEKAMELSGLLALEGMKDMIWENVYWLGDDKILTIAHDYLRIQNKDYWTEYIILQSQIDENNKLRLTPFEPGEEKKKGGITIKDKQILREDTQEMIREKEVIEKKFYGQFIDLKDGMRKRMVTMENRAMNILDNVETD